MMCDCIKNNKKTSAIMIALIFSFWAPTVMAQKFIRPDTESSSTPSPNSPSNGATKGGNSITNQLSNIASINGLLVGYGFYCNINPESIKVLHTKYFEKVARISDESYKKLATEEYEAKVKIAREKGPEFSKTNCEFVVDEYKKIMNLVNKNADKLFENNEAVIRKKAP